MITQRELKSAIVRLSVRFNNSEELKELAARQLTHVADRNDALSDEVSALLAENARLRKAAKALIAAATGARQRRKTQDLFDSMMGSK